jgi:hypothetical protein
MINPLFAGDFIPPEPREKTIDLYSDELLKVLKVKDFSIVNLEAAFKTKNILHQL